MEDQGLKLPVIFKPDLGERGFMVQRINTDSDIDNYLSKMKYLFHDPGANRPTVGIWCFLFALSKSAKRQGYLCGHERNAFRYGRWCFHPRTTYTRKDRAKLQWETLKKTYSTQLNEIVPKGKTIELVSIGNHCLGTKFLDGSHLINDRLSATFDEMSKQIEGFYFGRFDLRCTSLEDLYNGNVKILELNGCGAEPAHIYHPGYSVFKAIGVLLNHWKNIFLIARENAERGTSYIPFKEAKMYYKRFKAATQLS